MKNISKREKIILAVVAVALLYGVYDLVLKRTPDSPSRVTPVSMEAELRETDALVVSVMTTLKESELSPVDSHIIELAGSAWPRDPFFVGMPTEKRVEADDPDILTQVFTYTGYVEVGPRRMAIINGVDYEAGDAMEIPGFVVRSVTPGSVVIEHREERRHITVPFMEE